MTDDINDRDGLIDSQNASSVPATDSAAGGAVDPNDEVPVPQAMWPSEIDERAQVVEALRGKGPVPRTDTQVDPPASL
ncbi:MAG: hypothetical protein JWM41_4213 [Gemmatimonadetes bacterium]|nr:hypothetical protein [Gemmatimonadota bacterium]